MSHLFQWRYCIQNYVCCVVTGKKTAVGHAPSPLLLTCQLEENCFFQIHLIVYWHSHSLHTHTRTNTNTQQVSKYFLGFSLWTPVMLIVKHACAQKQYCTNGANKTASKDPKLTIMCERMCMSVCVCICVSSKRSNATETEKVCYWYR